MKMKGVSGFTTSNGNAPKGRMIAKWRQTEGRNGGHYSQLIQERSAERRGGAILRV